MIYVAFGIACGMSGYGVVWITLGPSDDVRRTGVFAFGLAGLIFAILGSAK